MSFPNQPSESTIPSPPSSGRLAIKGWVRTSLVDYPGKIVSTLFLPGCNFKCGYCHNPEVAGASPGEGRIDMDRVIEHLTKRRRLVDGVCVSGGEPLLHRTLPSFLRRIKAMGLLVKVDTNGSLPGVLEALLDERVVDYVAMDVKGPREKLDTIIGCPVDVASLEESMRLLKSGGVDYEFRTTFLPELLDRDDIARVFAWIGRGRRFYLQQFRPSSHLDERWSHSTPHPPETLHEVAEIGREFFDTCEIRGL